MIHKMQSTSKRWTSRLIWMLALAVAVGAAAAYFHQHPEELPEWAAKSPLGRDLQTTTVYKWQDASGRWHISDSKPEGDVEFQQDRYARDTNVLPLPPELQR